MQIPTEDFRSYITIKRNLASESVRHSMCRLGIINKWFADKKLTKENVEEFFMGLKQRELKNNSLNTYHTTFLYIRDYCKDRGLVSDFYDGFKSFKKTKPDIIIFTQEEIESILNTKLTYGNFQGKDVSFLDFRHRTLTMFLAYTGCRFAEAADLQIKRLDLSAGKAIFINTKTNNNRTVFITEPLIGNLKKITKDKGPDDLVFRNAVEKHIHPQDFILDLKRRAREAGVSKRTFPHNFRHTYITLLLESGVPITEVASLVGHKDIQTTYSTYMHLADKTLQKAAMRHPLVRNNVDPSELVKTVKETLENFHLESDKRFIYTISETEDGLQFSLNARK